MSVLFYMAMCCAYKRQREIEGVYILSFSPRCSASYDKKKKGKKRKMDTPDLQQSHRNSFHFLTLLFSFFFLFGVLFHKPLTCCIFFSLSLSVLLLPSHSRPCFLRRTSPSAGNRATMSSSAVPCGLCDFRSFDFEKEH